MTAPTNSTVEAKTPLEAAARAVAERHAKVSGVPGVRLYTEDYWLDWEAVISAALAEAGLVVVPIEPTEAMVHEGADYLPVTPGGATNDCAARIYEAMLSAKP